MIARAESKFSGASVQERPESPGGAPVGRPSSESLVPITVAAGDGIGPEIMTACLDVLRIAGAKLDIETVEIGEKLYNEGHSSGLSPDTWSSLRRTGVFYKSPITTPQGGGYKSLNVTLRKSLGMFANVRPSRALAPFIDTLHPGMDVVIVRENEEDLYAGIEHRQTDEVYQCLKLVSRPGCERIVRYAFEYARIHGRRKVSCLTKDNIMKMTDGLFHKVFDEIAPEYPQIEAEHWIVDIGAAKLASDPGAFDVVVTPNLYGDIVSDITAEISGSVGLGPSANIGTECAMFEAIHGSAPTIAGQDVANPSGLLLAGVMMLAHIGQPKVAQRVHNAWLRTIEEGVHTPDIFGKNSHEKVGTAAFAEAVIARMGQQPETLPAAAYAANGERIVMPEVERRTPALKKLVGVDVFLQSTLTVEALAETLRALDTDTYTLQMITNRGVKVWPDGLAETFCTDHWRCRFMSMPDQAFGKPAILDVLQTLDDWGLDFIKTEHLYLFDGEPGYSLGQGQ
ncbi:MAG: isocitrate dehydrogenase [Paracoccaceae bacterium]|jgi:isocitrate dehydrogenase